VVYGIRPEHLHASDDGTEAEVVVIEPTGAEVQIFAHLDGESITAVLRERLPLKPGETVRLAPDISLVHLFDRETGQRI
jgi:multiple sugar transport system ATP-binding protein